VNFLICDLIGKAWSSAGLRITITLAPVCIEWLHFDAMHSISTVAINLYLRSVLAQHRKIARVCVLYKAYFGEPAWKAIGDRLQRPYFLSSFDHDWKIRNRRQRRISGNIPV